MATEELAKRFLRLAGHWPKDTREPRGPEHMAKMKAARGPYSDPRDTYIMREIRWAFESSNGRPLSTGYLVEKVFGWQLRLNGKPKKSHHYHRAAPGRRPINWGRYLSECDRSARGHSISEATTASLVQKARSRGVLRVART